MAAPSSPAAASAAANASCRRASKSTTPAIPKPEATAPGARRFPRSARLTQSGEFARVREEGKAHHSHFFILSVRRADLDEPSRAGFITSRRVGNAVTRNRIRRRLREIVRLARPELKPGFWIVLIARRAAADATYSQLRDEWLRLSHRASIVAAAS